DSKNVLYFFRTKRGLPSFLYRLFSACVRPASCLSLLAGPVGTHLPAGAGALLVNPHCGLIRKTGRGVALRLGFCSSGVFCPDGRFCVPFYRTSPQVFVLLVSERWGVLLFRPACAPGDS
ncbi:unnamed protein product, partial [Ectocarpus sp. 12 AP-2014]